MYYNHYYTKKLFKFNLRVFVMFVLMKITVFTGNGNRWNTRNTIKKNGGILGNYIAELKEIKENKSIPLL